MKPYELHPDTLPLDRFTFVAPVLLAEASDFGGAFRVEQLYVDACDEGIAVRSHKTGRIVRFALDRIEHHDGDLVAWHFTVVTEDALHTKATRVTVFND